MDQDTLRFLLREAVRETVTEVLQTVLELDRTAFLQAHGGRRNGYYPRKLETTFGQVDLKVPRDREGQYYPAFLKPYARRLVDVGEVAVALYAAGVSQRKAAEVMSLLLGHRYSHETISAMTEEVLQAVEAFRRRPLVKSRFLWVSLPRPKAGPCPGNAGKPSPPWPSASPPWPDSPGSPRRGRPQPPWSAASPHG
jgi:transposase-like protein